MEILPISVRMVSVSHGTAYTAIGSGCILYARHGAITLSRTRSTQERSTDVTTDVRWLSSLDRDIDQPPLGHLVGEHDRIVWLSVQQPLGTIAIESVPQRHDIGLFDVQMRSK